MNMVYQALVDALIYVATVICTVLRMLLMQCITWLWGMVQGVIQFVWNYTIGIAQFTLNALLEGLGLVIGIDFSAWLYWFEVANAWIPISEALEISQGLYTFYLFCFAYRWIKWALPFI